MEAFIPTILMTILLLTWNRVRESVLVFVNKCVFYVPPSNPMGTCGIKSNLLATQYTCQCLFNHICMHTMSIPKVEVYLRGVEGYSHGFDFIFIKLRLTL